jgi:hypothetical protein
MTWQPIVNLFSSLRAIKRKYPMIALMNRYLENADDDIKEREVECFKSWLSKNPKVSEKILTDFNYSSSKPAIINFSNVFKYGETGTIDAFWKHVLEFEAIAFPEGRVVSPLTGLNPILADVLASVTTSNQKDVGKIVKKIQSGLASGKYAMADLTSALDSVLCSTQDPTMRKRLSMVSSRCHSNKFIKLV